MQAGWN